MPASKTPRPVSTSLERYRVPILDKSLDLLETLVAHPDGLTLAGLTAALQIPKNSAFRIASTLTLRGYLDRDEDSKQYSISRKLLALGHNAVGGRRLTELADPHLRALRDESGETALLGTLSGNSGVVLDQVASSHPVKVVVEIGHPFPLQTAAPAKAMLAFLQPEQQRRLVRSIRFKAHTKTTLRTASAYQKELELAAIEGVAYDRGEESLMFACVAAPVFDHKGAPVAALWISGPADRVTAPKMPAFGKMVRRHAAALSRALGHASGSGRAEKKDPDPPKKAAARDLGIRRRV
jgi:IclR family acetate operon transcriptional repressor